MTQEQLYNSYEAVKANIEADYARSEQLLWSRYEAGKITFEQWNSRDDENRKVRDDKISGAFRLYRAVSSIISGL